jgi:hypothetical protein
MRISRVAFSSAAVVLLSVPFVPAVHASQEDKFQLIGTATNSKDPVNSKNGVLAITRTAGGAFGAARTLVNTKITTLDDQISVSYYFPTPRSCGGGAPRIQLAIDTNGDGVSNGNAFGYIGPPPNFTGCDQNAWRHEDMTISSTENAAQANRWDLSQFGGPFLTSWDGVETFFQQPQFMDHRVLTGSLADDTFPAAPGGEGTAFYDDLTIGFHTWEDATDSTRTDLRG